eukprot:COSAG03_NODE_964_length_5177_cov_11.050807_5_plen_82_part_00
MYEPDRGVWFAVDPPHDVQACVPVVLEIWLCGRRDLAVRREPQRFTLVRGATRARNDVSMTTGGSPSPYNMYAICTWICTY